MEGGEVTAGYTATSNGYKDPMRGLLRVEGPVKQSVEKCLIAM